MRAAASLWKIPVAVQRVAKAAGCPAFKNNRVNRSDLEAWLKKNPGALREGRKAEQIAELRRQKLQEEVTLLRAKLHRESEEYIDVAEALYGTRRCWEIVKEETANHLSPELHRLFVRRVENRTGLIFGEPL